MIAFLLAALLGPVQSVGTPPTPAPGERVTPTGTRVPGPPVGETSVETQRATQVLQKFAQCVVNRQPIATAAFVDPPRSFSETERNARLAYFKRDMSTCLGRLNGAQMALKANVMVGMLAEQLYLRKFPSLPSLGRSDIPPIVQANQIAVFTTLSLADCLIDRDAAAVDSALRSAVNSAPESDAFRRISAHYGTCLNAGSTLSLNRLALRTALAEQLYRRALAASPGVTAAVGRQ